MPGHLHIRMTTAVRFFNLAFVFGVSGMFETTGIRTPKKECDLVLLRTSYAPRRNLFDASVLTCTHDAYS